MKVQAESFNRPNRDQTLTVRYERRSQVTQPVGAPRSFRVTCERRPTRATVPHGQKETSEEDEAARAKAKGPNGD